MTSDAAFPPTQRGFGDWTTRSVESFYKRYRAPLESYARRKFPGLHDRAEDMVQAFFKRELDREVVHRLRAEVAAGRSESTRQLAVVRSKLLESGMSERTFEEMSPPLYEKFDPDRFPDKRFRQLLGTSFYHFCRDELLARRERTAPPLEHDAPYEELEFERMILRDLLRQIREQVLSTPPGVDPGRLQEMRLYYDAKWPIRDGAQYETLADTKVMSVLGWTDSRLRKTKDWVVQRIYDVCNGWIRRGDLDPEQASVVLKEAFGLLRSLDPDGADPVQN